MEEYVERLGGFPQEGYIGGSIRIDRCEIARNFGRFRIYGSHIEGDEPTYAYLET
jgi:hypothetical protein